MQYETGTTRRSRFVIWSIGALLILALALIIDSIVYQLTGLDNIVKDISVSLIWLSPVLIFSLIALALTLRCTDEKSLRRIGLAIILFSLLCRLAWVTVFDSYQMYDFGYYLNCGAEMAAVGALKASQSCGGEFLKRSAFYTYPIVLVFGKSLLAIKLVNVLLVTLTSWLFFRLGVILFGARLAALGLLFFIWQPDLWYSMTLASHDVPGMFWLAIFLFICTVLQRRISGLGVPRWNRVRLAGMSALLGASIFLLDFTRTYHYAALIALTCYVGLESLLIFLVKPGDDSDLARYLRGRFPGGASTSNRLKVVGWLATLWLALPIGIYLLGNRITEMVWKPLTDDNKSSLLRDLTTMDVLGNTGDYEEIKDWTDIQFWNIAPNDRTAYAARKVLHDFTHDPVEYFRYLRRKNRYLSEADVYLLFSTSNKWESWDTTASQVKHINKKYLPQQAHAIAVGHAIVMLLVLWRLCLYPRVPFRKQEWILILFSGCFYAIILGLLECDPRYDVFLTFLLSWMAAQSLNDICQRLFRKTASAAGTAATSRYQLYGGGALLIVILAGIYWSASLAIRDSFLTLRDQSGFAQVSANQLPEELRASPVIPPLILTNNHKELLLAYLPGATVEANSVMAAQRTFTVHEKAAHHLRFFISVSAATNKPFDRKTNWTDTDLECLVAVNGKIQVRKKLNQIGDENLYVSLSQEDAIVFTPRTTLQLIIRNPSRIESVGADRAPVAALEYIDLQ